MRYDHLDMLPENAFKPMGKRMTLEGGGGKGKSSSPAPQNSSVYQTNIPEYAKPYVQSMLGAAQSEMFNIDKSGNITGTRPYVPYSTNPEDYVASFSPLQQTSFNRAAGLDVPSQFGQATQLGGAAGLGSLGLAGQAAGAGQQFQNMATNPNAVQAYMSPYLQASLDPQLEAIRRQYDVNQTQQQSQATQAGAFGGSREALMAAENRRAMNSAMNAAIGQGYNTAFNNAQGQMQFGANLGLQGLGQGLQGLGQAGQAAGILGNLGTNQLAAQQGVINTQNLLGNQQQAQQQNIINQAIQDYATAQQYPMMQLGNMSNLLRGLPMQSTTTQTYQAAPSALSQIGGLGATALGAYGASGGFGRKAGGTVKSYAQGGIAGYAYGGDVMSKENAQRIGEKLNSKGLEKVQDRTLPDYIRIPMIAAKVREEQASEQAKAAAQVQPNQQTIKDMVLAQAQGIDAAPTNLPTERMAGGGIVAFEEGGEVPGFAEGVYVAPTNYDPVGAYSQMRQYYTDEELRKKYNPDPMSMMGGMDLMSMMREAKKATAKGKEIGTPFDAAIKYYGESSNEAAPLLARRNAWIAGQKDPYTGVAPVGSKYNQSGIATATTPEVKAAARAEQPTRDVPQRAAGLRADEASQGPVTQEAPQKTLADYAKELKDYLGEDPTAKKEEERAKKLEGRAAKMEEQGLWNAIMQGGLRTMQGTSQFALANIGAGGEAGLTNYLATKDKVAALQDKADDYRSEISKRARAEQMAIAKHGADSKQAAEERIAKEKLQDKHDATLVKIQGMDDRTKLQAANIAKSARGEGKPMTIDQRLKLKEAIDTSMASEKKKILESLGSNAENPSSKAYKDYVRMYNAAKQRVTADIMGGGTTMMPEPEAATPTSNRGSVLNYVLGKGFINSN
jgi:hypothetical protein